uniref:MFS domain-containing protein n=1 Tax=Meloidogyne hapla TaxID=6305 RepID=A0A1I8BE68_MELHA
MSINNEDNQQMASRTRFMLLILVVLCLMINWANILTFNFTVICMRPREIENYTENNQINNNLTILNENKTNKNSYKYSDESWLTREFSNYEKSQAMAMVAIGALITNIPIVTLINWYGPRYLFTVVGFPGAAATALIP